MSTDSYLTRGGIRVHRTVDAIPVDGAIEPIIAALDEHRGVLLASSYEYPGRYTRWDMGFADPPIVVTGRGRALRIDALNARGRRLLPAIHPALSGLDAIERAELESETVVVTVRTPAGRFAEEERSRQPSVFSVLRALIELFHHPDEQHLGLYGAFGYDLAFQFEPIRLRLERSPEQRDLVLYIPDELVIVDHRRGTAQRRRYGEVAPPSVSRARGRPSRTSPPRAWRGRAITSPASTRTSCTSRARRSSVATSSKSFPARCSSSRVRRRRRSCSSGCASGIRPRTASS